MHLDRITLPRGTPTIIVDAVDAFMRDGTFVQHYERENAGDTEPVQQLLGTLEEMVTTWRKRSRIILCNSRYHPDQFVQDGAGLRGLCSDECPEDMRVSLRDDALEHLDQQRLCKPKNSILSATNPSARDILYPGKLAVLTGATTTSCIGLSVEDIREQCIGVSVVVPKDAVASRSSRRQREEELFEQWSDPGKGHVFVVDSWRNIIFE